MKRLKPYLFLDTELSVFICILNTLIELIQGPCIENQDNLSRSGILNDLFNLIQSKELQKNDKLNLQFFPLTSRIPILLLSMIEGRSDYNLLDKIVFTFNPSRLMERFDKLNKFFKISEKKEKIVY